MNPVAWCRAQWDRVLAVLLVGAGGIAIWSAYTSVSRQATVEGQVPFVVSGGLGGLFCVVVGSVLWLSADLRDEWRKLDDLESRLEPTPSDQP